MKRHLTIVSIPHCFWCTDLILELKFTLLWSNCENVLVWTHLCCLLLLFTMHREAMENSWLRKAESESQEIPCFCHNFALITECSARWKFCFFSCHSSLLLVLMHICNIIIDFIGRCLKSSIGKLSRQGFFFAVHHLSFMVMSADIS